MKPFLGACLCPRFANLLLTLTHIHTPSQPASVVHRAKHVPSSPAFPSFQRYTLRQKFISATPNHTRFYGCFECHSLLARACTSSKRERKRERKNPREPTHTCRNSVLLVLRPRNWGDKKTVDGYGRKTPQEEDRCRFISFAG